MFHLRFHRRFFPYLLVLAACAAVLQAHADPRYSVTVVGAAGSAGFGLNAAGEVVGYLTTSGGDQHALLYDNVGTLDLGTLGGASSYAYGINDAGQVVGGAANLAGDQHPFSYTAGSMSDLGTFGGASGYATAIDNSGRIVGSADTAANGPRAFLSSGGALHNLGTLPSSGASYSNANAISNNGTIVGGSSAGAFTPPEPPYHAFVRGAGGALADLGTFGGQYSEAFGVNDLGDVVGVAATADLHFDNAFLYTHGTLIDLGALGSGYTEAFDINNHSQVVGADTVDGGFLYEGGGLVRLNTLIDPASGWSIIDAHAINDAGQIAGTACRADACFAVRLDLVPAVPEPAGAAMLAAGLGLLGAGTRWRRRRTRGS
jgi:probable HAF family extracellular repeat protein